MPKIIKVVSMMLMALLLCSIIGAIAYTSAQNEQPKYGGTFTILMAGDPGQFFARGSFQIMITSKIYDAVIEKNENVYPPESVPNLAKSWEVSDDELTWTFHLVEDAKWHDGVPLTSADIKYSYENIIIPYLYHGVFLWGPENIESFETPDDYTFVVKCKKELPWMLTFFGDRKYGPVFPKHIYDDPNYPDPRDNPNNLHPIGSGPWKFVEYVKGSHIVLEKNEEYWKPDTPYLDEIIFKIIVDPSAIVTAFEAHEVDFVPWFFPVSHVERLQGKEEFTVKMLPQESGAQELLCFNLGPDGDPSLKDLDVRKAIAHSIDKELLNELAMYGLQRIGTGPIDDTPELHWCYNPDVTNYEYNLTKANEILDNAGYPEDGNGMRSISLFVPTSSSRVEEGKLSELIRDMLLEIGIECNLQVYDEASWKDHVMYTRDYDIAVVPLSGGGPDPAGIPHYSSLGIRPVAWENCMSYNNSRVDSLLDQAKYGTKEERKAYYYEFQEIILEDLPIVPLLSKDRASAWWNDFVDVVPSSGPGEYIMGEYVQNAENTWWTGGEVPESTIFGVPVYIFASVVIAIVVVIGIGGFLVYRRRK